MQTHPNIRPALLIHNLNQSISPCIQVSILVIVDHNYAGRGKLQDADTEVSVHSAHKTNCSELHNFTPPVTYVMHLLNFTPPVTYVMHLLNFTPPVLHSSSYLTWHILLG